MSRLQKILFQPINILMKKVKFEGNFQKNQNQVESLIQNVATNFSKNTFSKINKIKHVLDSMQAQYVLHFPCKYVSMLFIAMQQKKYHYIVVVSLED